MLEKTVLSPRLPPVSRLGIGSLTVSAMQRALPPEEAAGVLAYAFDAGINFVDTAQYYENYPLIRHALALCRDPDSVVIATKTYAWNRELAVHAVEEAREALGRDVIDCFLLHEQESYDTLRGHREALDTLLEYRERGVIRAVGASTHHVALVRGLLRLAEEGLTLDLCHPLFNKAGIGIADGSADDMAAALGDLYALGVGIYGMKALGGGHLADSAEDALRFVLDAPFIDAVVIGMQSKAEVDANIRFFETGSFSPGDRDALSSIRRSLHVEEYCEGCGACVERCVSGALSLVPVAEEEAPEGDFAAEFAREAGIEPDVPRFRACPDDEKCVRCGYCTKVCPVFALKIY
ncbi:MAG: aldo/keto reductase [Clostridia bacterium]|nr:aldo/keto reductase [Clostridia bacterium]